MNSSCISYFLRITFQQALRIQSLADEEGRLQHEEEGIVTSTGSLKYEEAALKTLFAGEYLSGAQQGLTEISDSVQTRSSEQAYNGCRTVRNGRAASDAGKSESSKLFSYDFSACNDQHTKERILILTSGWCKI
eukprot:5245301-Amphidinium_carterae.1